MAIGSFAFDPFQTDAAYSRWGPGEILVDQFLVQAHRFEDLRAAVALHSGDAHLGHHFKHAFLVGFDEVILGVIGFGPVDLTGLGQAPNGGQSQVWVDRAGAISNEQREVMNFAGVTGLQDQCRLGAGALSDQVMVDRRDGEQAGYGSPTAVRAAVRQYDDRAACLYRLGCLFSESVQCFLQRAVAGFPVVERRQRAGAQAFLVQGLDLAKFQVRDDGRVQPQLPTMFRGLVEQVLFAADKGPERCNQFLSDSVQGRVGHLGK